MGKKTTTMATIKTMVREMVKEEFQAQREQLMLEVKAEMFDALINGNGTVDTNGIVNENVAPTKEFNSNELKNMFSSIQPSFSEYGSNATVSAPPKVSNSTLVDPSNMPKSFEGRVGDETVKTMEKINTTNYGDMMKAMGITT